MRWCRLAIVMLVLLEVGGALEVARTMNCTLTELVDHIAAALSGR